MARPATIFRKILCVSLAVFWIAPFMPFPLHAGLPGAFPPSDSVRDAKTYLKEAAVKLELQTELPGDAITGIIPESPLSWRLPDFKISRRTAAVLLALACGVIIVAVLASARENMWSASRSRRLERSSGSSAPPSAAMRIEPAQAEADGLAKSGDYAGAIHALLLRSVTELKKHLGVPISASLTSREIWRMKALSPEERNVFGVIVGGVELSRFGAHKPGEDEYLECRRCFESLSSIIAGGQR